MEKLIILILSLFVLSAYAQSDSVVSTPDSSAVPTVDSAAADESTVETALEDSISADTSAASDDSALAETAVADSTVNDSATAPANSSPSEVKAEPTLQLDAMDVSVLREVKPGLLVPATSDPVRVMSSYSDTEGVEIEAGDTIAFFGEMGDSYVIVENEPFSLDDTVETLGLMPKYLVRIVAYPETVIVNPTVPVEMPAASAVAAVPLTFKEKMIFYKDKALRYVKENKKPVAIGGGAVGGLIVLLALLSGGDEPPSGGGGGGGDGEPMIPDINVGEPPD
ncbi:MAG: hypothetical protein JNL74_12625 [Fibrobacteres bacterium]|nr:hypothetical protein [Fibrobacterota bacterium]